MSSKPGKLSKHSEVPWRSRSPHQPALNTIRFFSGKCVKSTHPNGHPTDLFRQLLHSLLRWRLPAWLGAKMSLWWSRKTIAEEIQPGMVSWQTFGVSVRYNIVQRCTDYWNISKGSRMVSWKEDEERFNSWHWWHSNSFWDMLIEFFE